MSQDDTPPAPPVTTVALDAVGPAPAASEEAKAREQQAERKARKTKHQGNLERLTEKKLEAEIERTKTETETLTKKNLLIDEERARQKTDTLMRKVASIVFGLIVVGWLAAVWLVLWNNLIVTSGADPDAPDRVRTVTTPRLSDPVLIAALGTTTVNVVVLLHIVANYLFPKPTKSSPTTEVP